MTYMIYTHKIGTFERKFYFLTMLIRLKPKQWCNNKLLNHLTCDAKTNIVNLNTCRITTQKVNKNKIFSSYSTFLLEGTGVWR